MVTQTVRYQKMQELRQLVNQIRMRVEQLPDHQEYPEGAWEEVQIRIEQVDELIESLNTSDRLDPSDYSESEWQMWRNLVETVHQEHAQALQLLIRKQDRFYQEVKSVGRSVKANRAYNEMKRIRF